MTEKHYDARQLEQMVNHQAGLLGVSGARPDRKALFKQQDRNPAAQAVDMFCHQLRKHIGALTAVLGGLDTLVFTGGIGERAAPVQWEVCDGLAYLGIGLDPRRKPCMLILLICPKSLHGVSHSDQGGSCDCSPHTL